MEKAIRVQDWLGDFATHNNRIQKTYSVPYHGYTLNVHGYMIEWEGRTQCWLAGLLTGGDTSEDYTYALMARPIGLEKYVELMQKQKNIRPTKWMDKAMKLSMPKGWKQVEQTPKDIRAFRGEDRRFMVWPTFYLNPVMLRPNLVMVQVIAASTDHGCYLMHLQDAKTWAKKKSIEVRARYTMSATETKEFLKWQSMQKKIEAIKLKRFQKMFE